MKNWYIKITEENHSELLEWWNDNVSKSMSYMPPRVGEYLMSKNPKDDSCYWSETDTDRHGLNWQQQYELITLEQFREIAKPMDTHPEKWYIVATEDNYDELNRWRLSKRPTENEHWDCRFVPGATLLSEHPLDDSYFWAKDCVSFINQRFPEYKPITLEQFRAITNTKPMTKTEAKTIQIPHSLLIEYYEASTTPQREYLTKHFKLDGTTTDEAIRGLYELACGGWKPKIKANHPECFPEDSKYFDFSEHTNQYGYDSIVSSDVAHSLGLCRDFIQVRCSDAENNNRSFYLHSEYNWELVKDGFESGGEVWVLIPTKKVK